MSPAELKKTTHLQAATGTSSVPVQLDAQQQTTTLNRYMPDLPDGRKLYRSVGAAWTP